MLYQPVNIEYNRTMSTRQTKCFWKNKLFCLHHYIATFAAQLKLQKKQATTGNSYLCVDKICAKCKQQQEKCSTEPTLISSRCLLTSVKGSGMSKQRNMASFDSPEQLFCESPPRLSSSKLSPSLWIPITVAVEGGLMIEERNCFSSFIFYCVD